VEIGTFADDVDMLTVHHTDVRSAPRSASHGGNLRTDMRVRVALGFLASAVVLLTAGAFG
jgi:hypothetical protein